MNKRVSLSWVLIFAFTMENNSFAFDYVAGWGLSIMKALVAEEEFEGVNEDADEEAEDSLDPSEDCTDPKEDTLDAAKAHDSEKGAASATQSESAALDIFKNWGVTESAMHHMRDANNEKYEDAKAKRQANPTRPLIAHIVTAYKMDWKLLVSLGAEDKNGFKPDDVMFVARKYEHPNKGSTRVDPELFFYFMRKVKEANNHDIITSAEIIPESSLLSWEPTDVRRSALLQIIENGYLKAFTDILKSFPSILASIGTAPAYGKKDVNYSVVDWMMRPYERTFGSVLPHGYLDRKHYAKLEYIKAAVTIASLLLVDFPENKLDGKLFTMIALLARQGDLPQDATLKMACAQLDNLEGFDITSVPEDQREEISSNLSGDLKLKFEELRKKANE